MFWALVTLLFKWGAEGRSQSVSSRQPEVREFVDRPYVRDVL